MFLPTAIVILLGSNSISHSLRGGTLIMTSAYYSELRMETLRSESVISLHGHTLHVSSRYTFPVAAMPELLSVDEHVSNTLPHIHDEPDVNVFKCGQCGVIFITEDHLPIAGVHV